MPVLKTSHKVVSQCPSWKRADQPQQTANAAVHSSRLSASWTSLFLCQTGRQQLIKPTQSAALARLCVPFALPQEHQCLLDGCCAVRYMVSGTTPNMFTLVQLLRQEKGSNKGNQPDQSLKPRGNEPHVRDVWMDMQGVSEVCLGHHPGFEEKTGSLQPYLDGSLPATPICSWRRQIFLLRAQPAHLNREERGGQLCGSEWFRSAPLLVPVPRAKVKGD